MTEDEHLVLQRYRRGHDERVNKPLRKGVLPKHKDDIQIVEILDRHIAPLEENTVLFRGLNFPKKDPLNTALRPGCVFEDKGFCSTSLNPVKSEPFLLGGKGSETRKAKEGVKVLIEIRAPKGTPGHYLDFKGRHELTWDDQEVLLARGTKFRVISRETAPPPASFKRKGEIVGGNIERVVVEVVR